MLKVDEITKIYQEEVRLNKVSFELNPRECMVVTGNSKSGKSSLIKVLAGFLTIDKGNVTIFGMSPLTKNKKALKSELKKVGYVNSKDYRWYEGFSVYENLLNKCILGNVSDLGRIEYLMSFLNLEEFKDIKIEKLDPLALMKTLLAMELISDPILLLIDDFVDGMNIEQKRQFTTILDQLLEQDLMIIAATKDYTTFNRRHRALVLHQGSIMIDSVVGNVEVFNNYKLEALNGVILIEKQVSEMSLVGELRKLKEQGAKNIIITTLEYKDYSISR